MPDSVLDSIRVYEDELIAIRRDIHAHPETGFEEVRTAGIVAALLRDWGIKVHEGLGKTGVVGTLKGTRAGQRAIGLRADMDALHIQEASDLPYVSTVPGKMHACGHDGHTAMLLGAARYLSQHRDFPGTIHFVFQPAEEGLGGARAMVKEGLFEQFPMDAIYGLHAIPGIDEGSFAICKGPMMAASDSWMVKFSGTGGHGSAPNKGTDPTVPMAAFILGVQTIIGRNVGGLDSAVLSVGHVHGGAWGSPNIIPADVVLRGTGRSFRPDVRDTLERRLTELAHGTAQAYGCTAVAEYTRGTPPTVNWEDQTLVAIGAAAATVGADRVDGMMPPLMGSEDFSFMLEQKPGAYIMLGNGGTHYVHTPYYDFNDKILATGSAYWVNLALQELGMAAE